MQEVIGYKKIVSCILIVTIFGLCMPKSPLKAAMITTESVINLSEDVLSDRERVRAFLNRVILQQNSGVGVKPLFYYSNIPTHNSRVIYNHS